MADVKIIDGFGLSADLALQDGAPLAKAKLNQLLAASEQFFAECNRPLDQAQVKSVALGGNFTSPNLLSDGLEVTVGPGINGSLTIVEPASKLLFPDDGFSPQIPIATHEAWVGVEFDFSASAAGAASGSGVGVAFAGTGKLGCSTYTLFSGNGTPLCSVLQACSKALSNFSIATNAASVRQQAPGTVNVSEASGSITASVSLQQPFTLNPLASANLPFNETASLCPDVTLKLGTSIQIAGDFVIRSYKITADLVRLGVYKKHGTTFSASLTAAVGVGGDIASDDVLGAVLTAALPGVNFAAAGIAPEDAKALNEVVKKGLTRALSAQLNATCSAANSDEAALLYDVQLSTANPTVTDEALTSAFRGDWTALEALSNAKRVRNIAVETVDRKLSLAINLFGFYSAISTVDYLKSCTILVDENGQLSITDKTDASRISASVAPDAADAAKLRRALMQAFVCTATYAAVSGKLNLNLDAHQSYLDYKAAMSRQELQQNVAFGYALRLIPQGSLDAAIAATPVASHASISATVRYGRDALLRIFYKDPVTKALWSRDEIEATGRRVMCMLLNSSDPLDAVRLRVLQDDNAWKQMDTIGDTAAFNTIPALSQLSSTQLAVVGVDWTSIAWWADSLTKVAPTVTAAQVALESAPAGNPAQDPSFMQARAKLAIALGAMTRNTRAAFAPGWGEAVLFILSGRTAKASMDLAWNSKPLHFASA